MRHLLFLSLLVISFISSAQDYIGQWTIEAEGQSAIAYTRDGDHRLFLKAERGKITEITIVLDKFLSFGAPKSILEYSSPKYGLIRTTEFSVKKEAVIISDPFEIHSFVETLINISTQFMFTDDNFGNSFTDRKLTIAYMQAGNSPQWQRAKFSTVEIDEVMSALKVEL